MSELERPREGRLVDGRAVPPPLSPTRYLVNGRPVSAEEWGALPNRMEWGEGRAPMTLPAWDERSTITATGRPMSREEWRAMNKANGLVEVSMQDMQLKRRPSPITPESVLKIVKAEYARINRIDL